MDCKKTKSNEDESIWAGKAWTKKFLTSGQNGRKDSVNAQSDKGVSRNKTMKWNFASAKNIKNDLHTNKTKKNERNNEKNTTNAKNIVESFTNGREILATNDKDEMQDAF